VAAAIDNNPNTGWAIEPQVGKAHAAYFQVKNPIALAKGTVLTFTLLQQFAGKDHNLGRFRLSVTTAKGPLLLAAPPEPIAKILATDRAKRTPAQKAELTRFFRSQDAELARLQREAAEHPRPIDKRQPGAQDLAWALINSKAFQFNH
jgi:hypothetical protein